MGLAMIPMTALSCRESRQAPSMRTAKTEATDTGLTDSHRSAPEKEVVSDVAGRALVVVEPAPAAPEKATAVFSDVAFLAQLIATKDHHPQTRERRRAEPADAIGAYRAAGLMTE